MASVSNVSSASVAPAPVPIAAPAHPALTAEALAIPGLISQCILPFLQFNYDAMASFLTASPGIRMNRNDLAMAFKLQLESKKSATIYELEKYECLKYGCVSGHSLSSDKITELQLFNSDFNDQEFRTILERFPNLTKLQGNLRNITAASLQFLPVQLQSLTLAIWNMHDEDLQHLPQGLQELSLTNSGRLLTGA